MYKSTRALVTKILYFIQKVTFQNKDLEPAVKIGDFGLSLLLPLKSIVYHFEVPDDIEVKIFDLNFKTPLVGSSFKSDENIISIWLEMGIGGAILKTIMKDERYGNKSPRLQDTFIDGKKGLINALGLPGDGIIKYANKLENTKIWDFDRPIGLSIGGNNVNEYISNIKYINPIISSKNKEYFYELNISCPNTRNGTTLGENPAELENMLKELRKFINVPFSVKVSPDWSNETLDTIGEICRDNEKILINAGNTQYKTSEEVNLNSYDLRTKGGGLSGDSIFNRTVEMVKLFSKFKIPIIATGGISNANQIDLLKKEGANLFGMATSLIMNPYCIAKLNSTFKSV